MHKRVLAAVAATGVIAAHRRVFKDSMNLFQWFPFTPKGADSTHLWWITRDDAPQVPFITRAFQYRSEKPWFYGEGVMFRVGSYSFSIGIGEEMNEPGWFEDMDTTVDEISGEWSNGKEHEDDSGFIQDQATSS